MRSTSKNFGRHEQISDSQNGLINNHSFLTDSLEFFHSIYETEIHIQQSNIPGIPERIWQDS